MASSSSSKITDNNSPDHSKIQEALRVSQLDASELDSELFELLKGQLQNVFRYFKPNWLARFGPEVHAFLRYILWHYSVNKLEATIGQQLLDLRYIKAPGEGQHRVQWMGYRQKIIFAMLTIGGPWLEARTEDLESATQQIKYSHQIWSVLRRVSGLWKVAALVNFLVFLTRGRHQFLAERMLQIRAVFPHPHGVRQVGFEMMDRELLWHGFAEFLFFILPLVNFRKVKNFIVRHLVAKKSADVSDGGRSVQEYCECVVCGEWPFNPHEIGCRHVFCYYCIQSNYSADSKYACPICGTTVVSHEAIAPVAIKPPSTNGHS